MKEKHKKQLEARNKKLGLEIEALEEKQKGFLDEEYDEITKQILDKLTEKNAIMSKLLSNVDFSKLPKDLFKKD